MKCEFQRQKLYIIYKDLYISIILYGIFILDGVNVTMLHSDLVNEYLYLHRKPYSPLFKYLVLYTTGYFYGVFTIY